MLRNLLLASCVSLSLTACAAGDRDPTGPHNPSVTSAGPASLEDIELIPREALFGNPERANVRISPDGRWLSWVAPVDGTLNIWIAPANDVDDARAITRDAARGISQYHWSYLPDTLLYLRDVGGDENFRLFAVDLTT